MCVCDWVCVCKWEGGKGCMVEGGEPLPNDHSNDPNDHNFGGVAYRVFMDF